MITRRERSARMGNTTIIELDHDLASEIERDPDGFLRDILEQLRSGSTAPHRITGGRVVTFFARWGQPVHRAWEEWRARWGVPPEV